VDNVEGITGRKVDSGYSLSYVAGLREEKWEENRSSLEQETMV
jgi:hypothetical protein